MSPRKSTPSPLAARLSELAIEPHELAALCRVDLSTVETWIADGLDGESAILTRFLADADDARRRVEQLRRTYTRTLEGEGSAHSGVTPPYGTADIGVLDGEPVPTVPPLPAPTRRPLESVQDGSRYGGSK